MSQQPLDLRRSTHILWRHKFLVAFVAILGLLAGGAYGRSNPSTLTSTALVFLPQSGQSAQAAAAAAVANGGTDPYTSTQQIIAATTPVLSAALPHVRPPMSIDELRHNVKIGSLTPYVISVTAKGTVATDVEATANAVAESYISYATSKNSPGGQVQAQLVQAATPGQGRSPTEQLALYALLGLAAGAVVGAVVALAIGRGDRRLRERDQIANSLGVPVLASFPVRHPSDPGQWATLLTDYKPGALHALQLRKALQHLEATAVDVNARSEDGPWSVTILSLSSDTGALALGPQLAAFAASQGISTALVVGPQQDVRAAATLRAACDAPLASPNRPRHLRLIVSDHDAEVHSDAALTVVVAVVDSRSPQIPKTVRTSATLLGVSAGVATADQLARAAASAAADNREVTGTLVADPDPADATTGRLPQLRLRGQRRMPTRLTGVSTEIGR